MPFDLKSETARIDRAKSHGPKTPEGKEASSKNALKHGHATRSTIVLQCESVDEFNPHNFPLSHAKTSAKGGLSHWSV